MAKIFEQDRNYVLGDPELDLIGNRAKLAQWRHKGCGPAFYRLGRKIVVRAIAASSADTVARPLCFASTPHCASPSATGLRAALRRRPMRDNFSANE